MFIVNCKRGCLLLKETQAPGKVVQTIAGLPIDVTVYLVPVLHEQGSASQLHFEKVGVIEIAVGIEEHLFL